MHERSFLVELKRRNVYRAAAFYAAAGWLLVQVATQVFPVFELPTWTMRLIVIAVITGFPFAMMFSWFYEWTPQGIQRESDVELDASLTRATGKRMDRWIIAVLGLAVVLLLANTFVVHNDSRDANASASATPPSSAPPATERIPEKSIAILPLSNESRDKDEQYFSDGLSEDLITALSQFAGLKVISRNSAFQFRDTKDDARTIGEKLGVAHLLEGSVRRAGEAVRISAELVNAADGSTLWSQRYDRPYKDLFALQDDITNAVAASLKAKLQLTDGAVVQSDRPPSGSLAAWNAYSRGAQIRFGTPADYRKAIDEYDGAIALDPRYARAYAALSNTWTILGATFLSGEEQRQAYAKARTAVDQALQVDPDMAQAHVARGLLLGWMDFDWVGAEADFQRALELDPSNGAARLVLSTLSGRLGRPQQAVDLIRLAIATDPRNAGTYYWLGWNLAATGQLEEAEQAMRRAIVLVPDSQFSSAGLAIIQIQRGEAKAALATAQKTSPGPWREFALALALQVGDDRGARDSALTTLIANQHDGMPYQIAEVYGLRKDADNVFRWLDRAWTVRDPGINRLLTDPFLLPYKEDPRFAAFCKTIGVAVPGANTVTAPVAVAPGPWRSAIAET